MILYHGSNVTVQKPVVLTNGRYKDFGYGFYCTNHKQQAIRWALSRRDSHIVNEYTCEINEDLSVLIFDKTDDAWLDFVANCRNGVSHFYDIVEGPMANDTIWNYVEDFIAGNITRAAFWELAKFSHPTHQIVFCTERALKSLRFERSWSVDEK